MKKFLKYNIVPKIDEKNPQQAKFTISPLEKGMGNTLGNALRRTLLFDIPGASIFAIKINDATHEFQALKGIKEDVTQIILNLKGLFIKIDNEAFSDEDLDNTHIEQWPVMSINASGQKVITAADIEVPPGFEIINKDLYICELTTASSKLDLKIYATRGYGFTTFDVNHEKVNALSIIATDSNFSPIISVNYTVNETKISKHEVGDELTIELSTNGAISPAESVAYAAKVLSEHLQPIININEKINEIKLMAEEKQKQEVKTASTSIEDMNLSVRSFNCLKRAGIQTVQQLIDKPRSEVEKIKNLGRKSLREIQKKLLEYGLTFKEESEDSSNENESEDAQEI